MCLKGIHDVDRYPLAILSIDTQSILNQHSIYTPLSPQLFDTRSTSQSTVGGSGLYFNQDI